MLDRNETGWAGHDGSVGRDRPVAPAAAAEVEARWRSLLNNMSEGLILGEVIRGEAGAVEGWRCREMNEAARRLTGACREEAHPFGRGDDEGEGWLLGLARTAVDRGEAQDFARHVVALRRWIEGRCFPTEPDCFGLVFRDVTAEKQHARRQAALIELGDALRECITVPEITRVAATLVSTTLDVSRASYGHVDPATETVDIEQGWTAHGVSDIAGRHRFEDYGRLRDPLVRGEPLVIDDVTTDPRTATDPSAMLALGIGSLVNMPVRERGRTVAVFIAQMAGRHAWTVDELAFLRKVADRVQVGAARLQAEEQQRLINNEIAHRLKNQLAIVQALSSQTLRQAPDLRAANDALSFRLAALARATDLLMATDWSGAELHGLARTALGQHDSLDDRFRLTGPRLRFDPQISLALALAFHELATNAIKYGALSNDTGHVDLSWSIARGAEDGKPRFSLHWRERGGPVVTVPERRGFGSVMIERSLRAYFRGETAINYLSEGVEFVIDAPFVGVDMEGVLA